MTALLIALLFLLAILAIVECKRFMRAGVVAPFPAGMTPDISANFGLEALHANSNVVNGTPARVTTAGTNSTLTAAQALARVLLLAAGASGGFTITLPSTVALLAAMGATVPTNGTFAFVITIVNVGVGQIGTLTAGDGSTTVTGTATIATDTARRFLVEVASASTITITNIGSASL